MKITKHRGALLHRTNTGFEWLFSRRGRPSHSRGLCTRHVSIGTSALVDDSDAVGGRGSALSAFHLAGVLHYTSGTAAGTSVLGHAGGERWLAKDIGPFLRRNFMERPCPRALINLSRAKVRLFNFAPAGTA